jgi:acyl-CoA thioesterase
VGLQRRYRLIVTIFEADTRAVPLGDGLYRVDFLERWSTGFGVSGGFVAATMVRAIQQELADPSRAMRSITVHFLSTPKTETGTIAVSVERIGRGVSTVSVRLSSGQRLLAIALAAFAIPYRNEIAYERSAPALSGPPTPLSPPPAGVLSPPFLHNYRMTPSVGAIPFSGNGPAHTGGWIQPVEPTPIDAALAVALADAWWPSPFAYAPTRVPAPTIDLTVHIRAPLPRPAEPVFSEFNSTLLRDGLFEEDGRIRAGDGTLLAQSRQFALLLPPAPEARPAPPPDLGEWQMESPGS